jgi:hypothetical protein
VMNNHFPAALVEGNGETAPAQHYTMQTKPPGPPAPGAAPAPVPVQAAAAVPPPAKGDVPKRRPRGPGAGPTPIPATRPVSASTAVTGTPRG